MEITLEAIISLIGLFIGGGGGAFFTWRYMRRKAKAEAVQAEVDAAKDKQDYYQQIIEDVAKDRDYYKQERDEIRERMDKMAHSFMDWRMEADNDRMDMKMQIAKLGRKVESMVPFMCGDLQCKLRKRVVLSDDGTLRTTKRKKEDPKEIEPYDDRDDA
jgi:uncharacterized membrane-anchored protein YhcB (DUF1043 family)